MLGLTDMATCMLSEARENNHGHDLYGLFRQSVYARLAGYEDINDQEALSRDPAMRAIIGKKAIGRNAASTATGRMRSRVRLRTAAQVSGIAPIDGKMLVKEGHMEKCSKE